MLPESCPVECPSPRTVGEQLFLSHLSDVQRTIDKVCRPNRLPPCHHADFAGTVMVKLIRDDYSVLRAHDGRSQMSTYLHTVVRNQLRDYRNSLWGKWRTSAAARRLGKTAIKLERMIYQDGLSVGDAVETLYCQTESLHSRQDLENLASQLPVRPGRRMESIEHLVQSLATDTVHVSDRLAHQDLSETQQRVQAILLASFERLPRRDRELLLLHFGQGMTIAAIAKRSGWHQRSLYNRRDRCLRQLRRALQIEGLEWENVGALLGWEDLDLRLFANPA